MLTISVLTLGVSVEAQLPDIPTYLLITAAPNPVGKGQLAFWNAFLSKPTPTSGMGGVGDQYENLTVEMTYPDGTKQTLGPFRADAVGGIWGTITPTQVGDYKFKAFYPGQTLTYGRTYNGTVLLPSESETITLTVQEEPITGFSSTPLPTEYWTRPIYATNYDWAQLGGSWFGLRAASFANSGMYDAQGNVQLYSRAPNTAHILWTKPTAFGGQVGLPFSADQESQYTSTSILVNHFEPIIINGVLFYNEYSSVDSVPKSWMAVDLRTGETLWQRDPGITANESSKTAERLRMGQVVKFHSMQEFGSFPLLYSIVGGGMFGGAATYRLYDPMTGDYMGIIENVTTDMPYMMSFEEPNEGSLLGWYTSGGNLTMWNSTRCFLNGAVSSITLRPRTSVDFSKGIMWSVELPTTVNGLPIAGSLSIAARTSDVILMRYAPNYVSQASRGYAVEAGYDANTGQLLWGPINRTDIPEYQDVALAAAGDGYFVTHNKDTNEAYGFSLRWGTQLWGPVKLPGNAWSAIERGGEIAYGKVYIWDFGGYVTAIDLESGEVQWTFEPRSAGYDTPYGIYPIWHFGTHSIADGKIFLSEGSMYTPPIFPGAERLAIDCETGELVWSILSFSGRSPGAVADGMLVQWNSYDNQIYTFGKGPTASSISAPQVSVPVGDSVLLQGFVTDESPGSNAADRKARFPNGLPAIADESMTSWMEYVYMQQPKPTNATGVTIKLTYTDSAGATQDIGSTTSDMSGSYAISWDPPAAGLYTVTATFEGSESYYGSSSQTHVLVGAAKPSASVPPTTPPTAPPSTEAPPTATVPPTESIPPTAEPPTEPQPTEMYIIAAIASAIIIAAAVSALMLRRRK